MKARVFWLVIILGCCSAAFLFFFREEKSDLHFMVFDVGQGDALFVETPKRQQILIDGGPSNLVLAKLGQAMPFYDRSLDLVILTHPDADHLTGLIEVVRRYSIKTFLATGVQNQTQISRILAQELEIQKVPIQFVQSEDVFQLSDGVSIEILSPRESWQGKTRKETNATSIVARLVYQDFSILLTGDAPAEIEEEIIQSGQTVHSTVLKVGHHGSRTSTSAPFVQAVDPEVAVISVGKNNRYGHPHREVLQTLEEARVPLYRTDQGEDIVITADGQGYSVKRGLGFRWW